MQLLGAIFRFNYILLKILNISMLSDSKNCANLMSPTHRTEDTISLLTERRVKNDNGCRKSFPFMSLA